jgi:cell division topological specificity factor
VANFKGEAAMDFFSNIFGRPAESADIAKERLQLVLSQDRANISSETLNLLKDEIIEAISAHVVIDRNNVVVSISRDKDASRLVADIPVLRQRTGPPPPRVARRSPKNLIAANGATIKRTNSKRRDK